MVRPKKMVKGAYAQLVRQGDQYREKRDWQNAAVCYQAALEANPYMAAIWVQLGHALKEQGMPEDAEAAYRISLAMEPNVADTHLQLGHVLKLQSRPCEAGEAYAAALRLDPKLPYAGIELDALVRMRMNDDAVSAGERSALPAPLHNGAGTLSRLKQVRTPLAELQDSITDAITQIENCTDEFRANLEALEQRVAEIDDSWHHHVPAFVNAVGTVGAFGHRLARLSKEVQALHSALAAQIGQLGALASGQARQDQEIQALRDGSAAATRGLGDEVKTLSGVADQHGREFADLWRRLEFVRSELLYEMRYGRTANSGAKIVPRLLKPEKVELARQAGLLRLNLGCGHIALEGFINVDRRDLPGVDIVAEVGDLPFEEGSIHEIYSAHLLEHFPQEELRQRILPYWISLLHPGGRFRAVVPDGEAMLTNLAAHTYPFEHFREVLFGGQDYEGDFHYNLLTPDSLASLLREAGLTNLEIPAKGRVNGHCFEFEITAERPAPLAVGALSR